MKKVSSKIRKEIEKFKKLLPRVIKVRIIACKEGGFSARVLEPKSLVGVITEGENLLELTEMINDAVYCILDIPEKFYPFMPPYLAPKSLYEFFGFLPSTKTEDVLKFSIPV